MRIDTALRCLIAVASVGSLCGCADLYGVFDHFVGTAELSPPLGESFLQSLAAHTQSFEGRPIPPDINGGRPVTTDDVGTSGNVLWPAEDATAADLAGIWVQADGYGAIHIGASGRIFQADVAETIGGQGVPDIVPRTLFNVGNANVTADGQVQADVSLSLFGLSASGTVVGTLDATHNIIYDVTADMTVDRGNGPEHGVNYSPWLRWDPQTGALAG